MRREALFAAAAIAAALVLALGPAQTARAHAVGVSRGDFTLEGKTLAAELAFARTELIGSLPGTDQNGDGKLDQTELDAARATVDEKIVRAVKVTTASIACAAQMKSAALVEEDGLVIKADYVCPEPPELVVIQLGFIGAMAHGHRHLATATAGSAVAHVVAYGEKNEMRLQVPKGGAQHAPATGSTWEMIGSLFLLGIEHIITGYDHLLFLFALILVGGRLRELLIVVTAFTLAHSITLAIATLDVYSPSPSFVEPVIALSIAYVGVENFFVKDAHKRWMITFPFGLIHGFGFAGVLREISLPAGQVPAALAAFNIGVEIGQVAILTIVLPLVLWLRKQQWFADRGVKALSALVIAAGLYWFIERVT